MAAERQQARDPRGAIRLLRVIARLNVGGPAIQAITLTERMADRGYVTTLVRGRESASEGSMDYLAQTLGVEPVLLPALRRDPGRHDLAALRSLIGILRREQPQLIHTHAAKAGGLGRIAAILASTGQRRPPVRVHTFHGHSLTGYFTARTSARYLAIERLLARHTDRLVAVSTEVRDELIELGVASADRFEVIPLGFDLERFAASPPQRTRARAAIRSELGIGRDARVVTIIARLVPVKRVDRFLRACALLRDLNAHVVVVGDGELRESLVASTESRKLGDHVTWTGFRRDIPEICFASDVVALTSDNEGTPVSLIEAAAAGLPSVSTEVGGAATVVQRGVTGLLVPARDEAALAAALRRLLLDTKLRTKMGEAAQRHAFARFRTERLVDDLDGLYRTLLASRVR